MGAADVTTLARASADWLTGRASAPRLPVPLELKVPTGQFTAAAQAAGPNGSGLPLDDRILSKDALSGRHHATIAKNSKKIVAWLEIITTDPRQSVEANLPTHQLRWARQPASWSFSRQSISHECAPGHSMPAKGT